MEKIKNVDEIEKEIVKKIEQKEDIDMSEIHEIRNDVLDRECSKLCRRVSDNYTLLKRAKGSDIEAEKEKTLNDTEKDMLEQLIEKEFIMCESEEMAEYLRVLERVKKKLKERGVI